MEWVLIQFLFGLGALGVLTLIMATLLLLSQIGETLIKTLFFWRKVWIDAKNNNKRGGE